MAWIQHIHHRSPLTATGDISAADRQSNDKLFTIFNRGLQAHGFAPALGKLYVFGGQGTAG